MFALAAIVLLFAMATGEHILFRVGYFLLLITAVSYAWIRFSLWRLEMSAGKQPAVAQVGDLLKGCICIRNKSAIPTNWFEVVQLSDMPGDLCGGVTRLPGRWWRDWQTERLCHTRGIYSIGPLAATTSDPMGLFRVRVTQGDPVTVVVYPSAVDLPYFSLPVPALIGEERLWHSPQARTSHVSTIREYNPGDSLNRIHWPSTARYSQLMAKEFESPGGSDVWIAVDLHQDIHEGTGLEKTDEYAVAIAASVARLAITDERRTGLIAYGDREYLLPLGSGAGQMSRVLEMLAWAKTEGTLPLAEVLSANTMRFDRFAALLVVTSSTEIEWVSVLEQLVRRDVSVVVVIVDPRSFGREQSCCNEAAMKLVHTRIPVYIVQKGDSLPLALSRSMTHQDLLNADTANRDELVTDSASAL